MFVEVLLFLVFVVILDFFGRCYATRRMENIPLISKIPILGSIMALSKINPDNFYIKWPEFVKRFGKIFCARILGTLVVVTVDHRIVDAILSSQQHLQKHILYKLLSSWLGNGLLLSDAREWQTMRKIITPTFHFKILEQFVRIFDRQTDIFIKNLRPLATGQNPVNIYGYVGLLTMDIIAETAMGVTINAQMNSKSEYVQAVTDVTDILSNRFVRPHLAILPILRIFSPKTYRTQQNGIKVMHKFTNKVITERQQSLLLAKKRDGAQKTFSDPDDLGIKKRMALLDVLLQSTVDGQPLSDKQIRDEVNTFMFEGHDTTTSATSFCLYALSRHQDVQQKLFEELRGHFGDDLKRPVTYADLQQLNYLNCVIKESLRLYPPVMAIGRFLKTDLKVDNTTIPAGTNVIILLWEMLRDPEIFMAPTNFMPERHLSHNARANAYSNIPFSAGPRNCIGQKFAQFEMRTIITKVIRNYELLSMGEDIKPTMQLILRSKTGVNFALRSRSYV